jgi:hypothetical protein
MLKYKIQISPTGVDQNIPVNIKNETHLSGLSDDILNLVTDQTQLAINPTQDGEKRRFLPLNPVNINFMFWNGSSYVNNISPIDFPSITATTTEAYTNSFYVCQVFDSAVEDKQNLLHNGYLNGFQFSLSTLSSNYAWSNNYEYADIHIPKYFLDTLTANTFQLYMKFLFYSGKTGKLHPFFTGTTVSAEKDIYLRAIFDHTTRTYVLSNGLVFSEFTNSDYVDTVNANVASVNIQKPVYPTGTTFTTDGQYVSL